MIDLWATIATALITLAGAWFGYWLVGKPRLIVFSPNSTVFQLEPPQEGGHQMTIRAGQLVLQNNGRKTAHNVQLIAEPGPVPWGYNMFPPIDHSIRIGSQSEWILELGFLGPGENVTIQILNGPQIASVRSKEGMARAIPVVHQRVYPKWLNLTAFVLTAIGLITVTYGIISIAGSMLVGPAGASQEILMTDHS